MSTSPFEIKVVYDATRRKRTGAVVRTARAGRVRSTSRVMILGALLNLVVAGAMYYATWWKVDPFIYLTFMTKMPLEFSGEFAANPLGFRSLSRAPETPGPTAIEEDPVSLEVAAPWRWSAKTARVAIPATAYTWLTVATIGACAVAMAGGAWLAPAGGSSLRLAGQIGALILLAIMGIAAWKLWGEYKSAYKVEHLRIGMGLLTMLMGFLGLALADRARGITKTAGVFLLLAALATGAGMWLWAQNGALEARFAAWPMLLAAFAIHAAWGIVLLVSARRIRA